MATRRTLSNLVLLTVGLLVPLSSCAVQDFYGREYVIYDRPASSGPGSSEGPRPEQVLELERQAAELRAAVAAGLDTDGRIQALLTEIEDACREFSESLGDALLDARRRRVEVLLGRASRG
ncbi:MAG: hypothetical protein ACO4CZ_14775 [Planctomycetota bacterium]